MKFKAEDFFLHITTNRLEAGSQRNGLMEKVWLKSFKLFFSENSILSSLACLEEFYFCTSSSEVIFRKILQI
jgi:hypothetical protein